MILQQKQGAAIVAAWNEAWPVGTQVTLVDDMGKHHETKTRSVAWCLGHGEPLVSVEGRPGVYMLSRIVPVRQEAKPWAEAFAAIGSRMVYARRGCRVRTTEGRR